MAMDTNSSPSLVEDFFGAIQIYSDGTVTRSTQKIDALIPPVNEDSVLFKDCLFDEVNDLRLRLYKPERPPLNGTKLPVLVYLYGGGFCVGSRVRPSYHNTCLRLSSGLNALVVAPDTRLAPESKVPEAVEDGFRAMKWLQGQALVCAERDAWVNSDEVDFGRVFVVGDSSGGNIAHHLAVGLGPGSGGLSPVRVRGYVMMSPFFGGVARTRSEEGPRESTLSLEILDGFWRLCIPQGETRDHPLVNPFGPMSPDLEPVDLDPILCIVGGCEMLKDRAKDYATRLKELGKKIEYVELEGKQHGYFTKDPYSEYATQVLRLIEKFILQGLN